MDGSALGNFVGAGYFFIYQILGIFLSFKIWRKEDAVVKLLLGSVFGSILLQWMPALTSFGMGFNRASHVAALFPAIIVTVIAVLLSKRGMGEKEEKVRRNLTGKEWLQEYGYFLIIVPVFLFFFVVLSSHTIEYRPDGSLHTGQATNGDMNMHLAFISSIAEQGIFPPEYSLLPKTKLSYPFLCDTVSSSIYLWGSSLRFAYMLPMVFAILQVLTSVLVLAAEILKSRVKAAIAWIFFFLNGGFGIYYFVRGAFQDSTVFTRIFTEFYQTPTNFLDGNIRWTNIIVDMLLPQRATLFGWAVLLPALYVLYRAVSLKLRGYFVITAIMAGSLPMIHTHSFLAMGMVCAMWLIYSMRTELNPQWRTKESKIELWLLFAFFLLMCSLDVLRKVITIQENVYLIIGLAGILAVTVLCIYFVVKGFQNAESRKMVLNWAVLLAIVLLLALPQLFMWTFSQAQGEQFVRGYFNWANLNDTYLGFYFKNLGIVYIISLVALIFTRSRHYFLVSPFFFIWFVGELIVFQPNVYDNNKILYIGYLFLCLLSADYLVEILSKFSYRVVQGSVLTVVLVLSSISAVLTMGREYVSDYPLYSSEGVAMCRYIEKHTEPTDVILTDTRHNNEVVSLTGRNIVCGSSSFLYFHGLDYKTQEEDVGIMYQNPEDMTLFNQYDVKYIYMSDSERYNYGILSEDAFLEHFEVIHREGSVTLYKRREAE